MREQGRLLEAKGVTLLVALALLVWLAVAVYQKKFVSTVDIAVHTQRVGLQLNDNADVRMRGALVGRVTGIDVEEGQAVIRIALDEDQAGLIPAGVAARVLPTTLFGQKYVELVAPARGTGDSIAAGAVIPEDRSAAAIEITTALDHLQPVLTAVRPQDISSTLQALAEGLGGRGNQLGETAVATASLLDRFEEHLETLTRNLRLLAAVSRTYADSLPDLLRVLANATVTGDTLLEERRALTTFLTDVTTLSRTAHAFLDRNGDSIVELNRLTRPVLALLARYAPEIPCVLAGLVVSNRSFDAAFHDGKLHSFATLGLQQHAYKASDTPSFDTAAPGPTCAGLPRIAGPFPMPQFSDGGAHTPGQVVVP
ncbi:MAG TPA: MCE family protein [Nocardioidaceae bacterium]|nr:MCE family protein [Nocardioidaceae bacterium]